VWLKARAALLKQMPLFGGTRTLPPVARVAAED
jgi:hypothetical protein